MNAIIPRYAESEQDAFDAMVRHLASMTNQASGTLGRCMYRVVSPADPANDRCPVGALIPDDLYTVEMEERGVRNLVAEGYLCGVSGEWVRMADAIQEIHDDARNWARGGLQAWDQLGHVADHFDLSSAVLREVQRS